MLGGDNMILRVLCYKGSRGCFSEVLMSKLINLSIVRCRCYGTHYGA